MNWSAAKARDTVRRQGTESLAGPPALTTPMRIGEGTLNRKRINGQVQYGGMLRLGTKEYPVSIFKREGKNGVFLSLVVWERPAGKRKAPPPNLDRLMDNAMERDP
jgi:hypothetical protein